MSKEWRTKKLGELDIDYFKGISLEDKNSDGNMVLVPSGAVFPNGIKVERTKRFFSSDLNIGDKVLCDDDILFNCGGVGTLGRSAIFRYGSITDKAVSDSFVLVIRSKNTDALSRYIFYFLQSEHAEHEIISNTRGTTGITSIRTEAILGFEIPLPSLGEQQRIIDLLDEAFAGLAIAKANAEKNLENAHALFESYLQSIFVQRGEGWSERRLIEISKEFGRGKSRHRPRNEPSLYGGPHPFIQTGDVSKADHWLTEYTQTYSELGLAQSRLWPRGTICIAIVGATVGETAILDFEACFPDSVIGIVINDQLADNEYVEFLLQAFKEALKEKGKGTARDNINLGTFENQTFPFPALKRQKEIVATLNELREESRRLESIYEQKLAALAALKKSLLNQAFDGQL